MAQGGVQMFNDISRYLAVQTDEIESLRKRHNRLTAMRKEAIAGLQSSIERGTAERKKGLDDVTNELEQFTLKKFELLKDDITAWCLVSEQQGSSAESASFDEIRRKREMQLRALCLELDVMHASLQDVAQCMSSLVQSWPEGPHLADGA
mmetsp:Transcript_25929/g.69304  ORF Transcript_25929/g.69304 Transcript_25929/m.69304 type:complete len:150 (-) Transcript_25929:307-756(-)